MKKEEIHLGDVGRILFGEAPPVYLLEVLIRALITYTILLFIIRWLGKRMSGQLTIMEMSVMITLGAIVSIPMQTPDRGILQGIVLLLCAVGFQRGISFLGFRDHKTENVLQGKPSLLVRDGVIDVKQMASDRISRQQLFAELRQKNICNLGTVERVYLEPCGFFSIYNADDAKPGLPTYPPDDDDVLIIATYSDQGHKACLSCGKSYEKHYQERCTNCNHTQFTNAII